MPPGTLLTFGEDAWVRKLGTLVVQAARIFHVIGFTGNCLRQSMAAIAMFGTPDLLEQLRFGVRQGISLFVDGEGQSAAVIAGWQVGSLRRGFF